MDPMDPLHGLRSPRLPVPRGKIAGPLALAGALHALVILVLLAAVPRTPRAPVEGARPVAAEFRVVLPPTLLFLPAATGTSGGGGGGGGNRQAGPIRRAEGVGHDAMTMPTRRRAPARTDSPLDPGPPAFELDARPLASGNVDQLGLPVGGVPYGTSTGPGSGGGVGTGEGTGLGSGHGPGVGPGSGGGFGGGAYRPGGVVSPPRLLSQVTPKFTADALERRIQGVVWLEAVVRRDGRAGDVRVQRSLDPGLDEQAILALRQWVFEPGRLGSTPVDVLVSVVIEFWIR
jgi:TonB family protein